MTRIEYTLDGVCCTDCAQSIQIGAEKLDGVRQASVNTAAGTLTLELSADASEAALKTQIEKLIRHHGIAASEKTAVRTLYLQGLSCPDCAHKIERAVKGLDGVKTVSLDLVAQRLVIEAQNPSALPELLRKAAKIVRNIEPGVTVSFTPETARKEPKRTLFYTALAAGAALFIAAAILGISGWPSLALHLAAYGLVGGKVVVRALKNITRGKVFDENFLMTLATISAFAIGEYPEGVAVMLFYQVGELLQGIAVSRSRRSITALTDIRPDSANLQTEDGIVRVSPHEVGIGDVIVVRPGEKIPLDGIVVSGSSTLDTSALTGESLPRDVEPSDEVLAGSINGSGLLTVSVTKEFGESTLSKILELVQSASNRKARIETFITRFSRYYTPAVVFAALALAVIPPLLVAGATFADWLNRALVFLVVSCPCALVISIPLGFFGGIGGASKNGILVKGGSYLEALGRIQTAVFDKTGTLTRGVFKVSRITADDPNALLRYAAYAESSSTHPIATSIRQAYGRAIDTSKISELEELAGFGVRVTVEGRRILVGNARLLKREGISFKPTEEPGTVVYVAVDGTLAGSIVIEDELRPGSAQTIAALKALGVKKTAMLTGDSRAAGQAAADALGLDAVYTGLLPHQKVEKLEEMQNSGTLAFVGDGINDAPVLAMADVGIAMGGAGSDAAIEAADVVLMTDEPYKLVTGIRIARKTQRIVWQNIALALGVKAVILALGAFGIATMWEAVFGDVGVALLAILNAMRAMRTPKS